ncbi:calpain-8-like [Gigantopelta aegis]|uniref:calpain-8-like n=1 Tax=Gigantopelta aegis TaxID=1735272 RepID=UPI001B88B140|nr:calpain-8-like [Gigantopelta aegis]
MGCSASMEVASSPTLPSAKIICPNMDEVEKKPTPRNWTNIIQNHSRKLDRLISANRELYIDPEFPPEHKSIYRRKESRKTIVWRRPGELSLTPSLISDGTSRHDMKQGDLNDCWFLSTLSAIAEKPQLISKIIPDDNTFGTSSYDGRFHCRFWQFGDWVDVFIDDLLPTVNGEILFAHSSDPSEFWVSLVEKAYAKLNQSYEALEFGFEADAFTDLTGGLAEWYNPHDLKESEFYLIRAAFQCGAVIGCLSVDKEERGVIDRNGMISNHSYVITGVEEIPHQNFTAKLIRVRNPWGDTEWQGAWCDGSDEWSHVPEDVKLELELTSQDDGEFWMCFQDFRREYCNMIICNLSPDFDNDGISDKAEWQMSRRGKWQNGTNAGGWLECDTFHLNPQYLLILYPDVNVQRRYSGRLPLAIALMQEYKRSEALTGGELYAIGFEIFYLRDHPLYPLGKQFFQSQDPLMPENEETYAEYRETSGRFFLIPGEYLLVPSTHQSCKSRNYLLRTFSVGKMDCRPLGNCLPADEINP